MGYTHGSVEYFWMTVGDTHVEAYSACHRPSKHVLLRWFLLLTLSSGGCWLSFPPLLRYIYIYIHICVTVCGDVRGWQIFDVCHHSDAF